MESKKISELEHYNGSADGFMVPGVADGETQKADLGALVEGKATAAGFLKPSGLKTINGETLAGSGDIDVEMANPFKGWYATLAALQAAVGSPAVGDYAYIKGATASDPAAIYECATAGTWSDSGRTVDASNVQTFETGQAVNGVAIDGTGLINPAPNALAKATDVMPLAVKLKGVTADESRYPLGEEQSKAINGNNGNLCSDNFGGHFDVNLDTSTKKVRFQAVEVSNQSTYPYGYCFYSDSEGTVAIQSEKYKLREGSANQPYELIVDVPQGAVVFKFSVGSASRDSAYCYLQTGESVGDVLGKVQPDEQLSTTSEKPIANNTITNFLFYNFTKEIDSEHQYTRPLKVSGDLYDGGMYFAHNRVYPVTPGKQYIVTAWQWYYNKIKYAYAGFYALPENYGRSDISASTVCKGKDGDADAPYTYTNEENKSVYVKNVILTAPEGATHLVLIESHERQSTENIVEFPANLRVVGVAAEQQEEEGEDKVNAEVNSAVLPLRNYLHLQNRDYYLGYDITQPVSAFLSMQMSYIDRRIASIPKGKHFMMWTDPHVDYANNVGLQQDAIPVMAYIKERLGIRHIINGGDVLGESASAYKAAAIIETYCKECFDAFGQGLLPVLGNHDANALGTTDMIIPDYDVWVRMFQSMEIYGDVVYAENVLHNIETCELLTDDEKMNLTAWAKMNYYIDDPVQKIRYYVSVSDDPGSVARTLINGSAANFNVFIDFFANALKDIPEGYDFVYVTHILMSNKGLYCSNPYWTAYSIMGAWKKRTTITIGGGTGYNDSIFHGYKQRDDKIIAKWITSGKWDDNGRRTYDFSNHKGTGRVFALGGHYHVDRARFSSIDNGVFQPITYEDGINGNTSAGNILYDLGHPENNAYAEEWQDAMLSIDVHNTTLGGMSDAKVAEQQVHRYELNGEVVDGAYNDLGADWTGNEGKVYREYYEAGARKSVKFPNGGSNGSSFVNTFDGVTLETPATVTRLGTVNEICCDVITITDDNHVVCTRFGAGFDRDYKLPSIPSYSIYAETTETEEQTTENAGE